METLGNKKGAKTSYNEYYCEFCKYKCCKKYNWNRHILTSKHIEEIKTHNMEIKNEQNEQNEYSEHKNKCCICEKCNKEFQTTSGLWKHKQKCNIDINDNNIKCESNNNSLEITPELILALIKQNNDFQQTIIEQNKTIVELSKNGTSNNNIINNNISNSNNKTFNLQVFLNETCKDAMNISEFVESIKLQVSDLENVGRVGYIEGISNIIIKNLQALEVEKRPIHCTDQKREVMYVKDGNIWEKEDETNKKVRKLVRSVAHKNICMLKAFRDKYPDCEQYESKRSSQYNKLVIEAMGGKGDDDYEKNTKIIKKIAKAVGIDKN